MKKLLLSLAIVLPSSVFAADNSVYAWGPWAEGIKPAAGPVYVAPAPVSEPQVDTRESMSLMRQYHDIDVTYSEIQYFAAPPAAPSAPQVPGVVGCSPACPSGSGGLGGGGSI